MEKQDKNTLEVLLQGVIEALVMPLYHVLSSPSQFERFMRELGWNFRSIPEPFESLHSDLQPIFVLANEVIQGGINSENLANAKEVVEHTLEFIHSLEHASFSHLTDDAAQAREIPAAIVHLLLVKYVQRRLPSAYEYGQLFGIITKQYKDPPGSLRVPYLQRRVQVGRIFDLLQDPVSTLKQGLFNPNSPFVPNHIIDVLTSFASGIGFFVSYERFYEELGGNALLGVGKMTNLVFFEKRVDNDFIQAGVRLLPSPAGTIPGIFVLPYISGLQDIVVPVSDRFELLLSATLDIQKDLQFFFHPLVGLRGLPQEQGGQNDAGQLEISWRQRMPPPITKIIAWSEESYIGYEQLGAKLGLSVSAIGDKPEIYFEALFTQVSLQISIPERLAFLKTILPPEGIKGSANLGIGWSRSEGLYHRWESESNLSGLRIERQIGNSLNLRLEIADKLSLAASLAVNVSLGPCRVQIDNFGLSTQLQSVEAGGNLGLLDLDVSFAPPTGLGFSIDAKVVKGGGFLSFDRDKGEYIGFAELQVLDTINVKAIGIINTKLPDGQAGYSFLLMVVSEFQPLQLGLGFTLEGVGGIVGLHRGLNLDNIRGAVSSGEFDYILFPEDALANLPKIIAGLNLILPIQKNHYAFGLMARFGWGSPKMLDIKLGLLFELPNWKLALIGVAKAEIKRGEKLLARLQLDFAITYDPGEAFFSFDAQLKNSKLLIFELSGDFAIRIKGGDDPQFLISAGGFHKEYQPPASLKLPAMQRLKIAMKSGNPTIQAEAFFAITTNTFQFGAAAVAKYNKSGISFYAELGFAALIQFDPLYFKAEVWGAVELDFWGAGFGLELRGTIEGPYPIHFDLYVKFKIWIFSFTVRVPKITIGAAGSPALPKVDIWPLLEQQLADNRNWQAVMPINRPTWVSFRSSPDGTGDSTQVRIHPLATITISQSQVPLRIPIERFGAQQPADYQNFSLELAGTDLSAEAVREFFAPAQYFNLTEEERFRTKAYEKYEGGLRIDAWDNLRVGAIVEKVYDYETKIIVDNEVASHRAKPLKDRAVQTLLEHSSQAQSTAGRKDQRRGRQRMRFRRQTSAFALVHLLTDEQLATAPTQQEAEVLRRNRESSEPHLRGQLAIIPLHELETA